MTENDGNTPEAPASALSVHQLQLLHAGAIHGARVKTRDRLAYVEAWDIKAMMTRVFGYAGWSSECLTAEIIRAEERPQVADPNKMNWSVTAKAAVRLTVHQTGAVYTEYAIANNAQPSWHEAADTALKSAESDAFKRAAINLGTQFGLSLYDSGSHRDVIRRVVAPGQREIIEDLTLALEGDNAEAREAARARLQARLNVAESAPAAARTGEMVGEVRAPEPATTVPADAPPAVRAQAHADAAAARKPKTLTARQEAARAALAAAEAATGVAPAEGPVDDRPNEGPLSTDDDLANDAAEDATWK